MKKIGMEETLLFSHLSVALLRLLLAESNRKPLAWDSREERSLQRSKPQHHRAENRGVNLELKGNRWRSGTQLWVVLEVTASQLFFHCPVLKLSFEQLLAS